MIGYNRLSIVSEYILDLLEKDKEGSEWPEIESYTTKAIELLQKIKSENAVD